MKNRTTVLLAGWSAFGAAAAILVAYWDVRLAFGFVVLWLGATALILTRTVFVTQHKQMQLLREVSRQNVEARRILNQQAVIITDLNRRTAVTSKAVGLVHGAVQESNNFIASSARMFQAIELNQEYILDRYADNG